MEIEVISLVCSYILDIQSKSCHEAMRYKYSLMRSLFLSKKIGMHELNAAASSGLDESLFKTCGFYPGQVPTAATVSITCTEGLAGSYVALLLKDDTPTSLIICEFKVYGRGRRYPVFCVFFYIF